MEVMLAGEPPPRRVERQGHHEPVNGLRSAALSTRQRADITRT